MQWAMRCRVTYQCTEIGLALHIARHVNTSDSRAAIGAAKWEWLLYYTSLHWEHRKKGIPSNRNDILGELRVSLNSARTVRWQCCVWGWHSYVLASSGRKGLLLSRVLLFRRCNSRGTCLSCFYLHHITNFFKYVTKECNRYILLANI